MEKIKELKKALEEEAGYCCSIIDICMDDPIIIYGTDETPFYTGLLLDGRILEFRPMQSQIVEGLGFYIYEIQGKAGTGLDHAKISKHADADYIATFVCEHEISLPEDGILDIVDYIFYEGKVS